MTSVTENDKRQDRGIIEVFDSESLQKGEITSTGEFKTSIFDSNGNPIDVNYPLPTDGDRIYCKDVDTSRSSIGTFTGDICSLFIDPYTSITDSSATNPKTFTVVLYNSIKTTEIGITCTTGNFSNVKILLKSADGTVQYTLDESSDSTDRTGFLYKLTTTVQFSVMVFEFHTADEVCISGIIIPKVGVVESRLAAQSQLTGEIESVNSYRGALSSHNPWPYRKIANETYHQDTGTQTTPSIAISEGDISATLTSVVGLATGGELVIYEGSTRENGLITITNITGNVVTFDRPIANDYTTAAVIKEVTSDMAVNGSLASPEIFEIDPPIGTVWQITRIFLSITSTTDMDDSKFGGITALTNGVALRAFTAAGRKIVFANWKSNADMKLDMYDVKYADKAPAGFHGLNGRWTFTKAEVVAELDGDASPVQKLEVLVQDNLTGLTTFKMRAQGRVFSP